METHSEKEPTKLIISVGIKIQRVLTVPTQKVCEDTSVDVTDETLAIDDTHGDDVRGEVRLGCWSWRLARWPMR